MSEVPIYQKRAMYLKIGNGKYSHVDEATLISEVLQLLQDSVFIKEEIKCSIFSLFQLMTGLPDVSGKYQSSRWEVEETVGIN